MAQGRFCGRAKCVHHWSDRVLADPRPREPGFGDDFKGALVQRPQRRLGVASAELGANDEGNRVLCHDSAKKRDAIHTRRGKVEEDDVGAG